MLDTKPRMETEGPALRFIIGLVTVWPGNRLEEEKHPVLAGLLFLVSCLVSRLVS